MTRKWSTACTDWGDRLKRGESIIPPPIFQDEADKALQVFKALRIVDAPGSPTFGEACAPWVFDLAASIFGAYDASTGRRLITEWFVLIPKKNSKSTIAAGIMMTALILNWRLSGEFTILAPTIEVAGNSYNPARDMCAEHINEDLHDLLHTQNHVKTIAHRTTQATLKVVAADANTAAGKKSIGTLVDEIWLFGKQANAANMLREAVGGLASRPEGFVVYLTTQSDEPPSGVFKQKLEYARKVRDGEIVDQRFVPVLFEHPIDMVKAGEHLLAENLAMVNPNLGYSVDDEFLQREYVKAKAEGEESFRGFLAKHANVEIGMSLRSDRWAGADYWQHQGQTLSLDDVLDRSEVVAVGIDGGGLDDLLGLAVAGREKGTGKWLLWTHAWAHPSVLERRKSEAARFQDFAKDGNLTLVDRIGDDVQDVADICMKVYESGLLDKIGCDPAGIGAIEQAIVEAGVPEDMLIGISQGWKLTGAIKTTERKLAEGALIHSGQPLMAWCVGNAKVEPRGNAIIITKQAAGAAKIDPLMATFNAISLLSLNPVAKGKSVYEQRGIRYI